MVAFGILGYFFGLKAINENDGRENNVAKENILIMMGTVQHVERN